MRAEFEAGAPYFAVFFAGGAAMAIGFGLHVAAGGSPVTPETYGTLVHQIPALVWVWIQIVVAVTAALGFALRRPILAAIGGWCMTALLAFFGVAASAAPQGAVLMHASLWWAGPITGWGALVATRAGIMAGGGRGRG